MSYARLFYHIIWATKRREPLINDENRQAIYPCIVDKVVTLNGFVHALNGMPDHVHLVVTIPATIPNCALRGSGERKLVPSGLTDRQQRSHRPVCVAGRIWCLNCV